MPNRYEREIEEILRNLEQPESKSRSRPGLGRKFGDRSNQKPGYGMNMRKPRLTITLSPSERFLLMAIVSALIAGGYAYLVKKDIISLFFALVSVISLILLIWSQFRVRPARRPSSTRYGNVTITPLRRDPLSTLRTRWNLFKLRMRYRRKNEK
jgi:hypothetical protein